jgi:2'-5' RNA ligase
MPTPSAPPESEVVRGDPECVYRHVVAKVGPSVDPSAAVDVACFMTTDSVDADDEVVLPAGGDLSRFEKNPVVMLCHAYGQPGSYYPLPVGRVPWSKKRPTGILAGVKFAESSEMGRQVKGLFDEDMLRSFSIGFRPLESSPMTRAEADSRPDWKAAFDRTRGKVLVHRRWQLLELSVAPVPCNEDALVTAYKAKGVKVPAWLKLSHPEPAEAPMPVPAAAQAQTKASPRVDLGTKAVAGLESPAGGVAAAEATPADARVMVALYPPPETAAGLAIAGGDPPDQLHLTLCYLGTALEVGTNAIDRVKDVCRVVASCFPPVLGKVSGVGRFSGGPAPDAEDVVYASVDAPGLAELRQRLAEHLAGCGIAYSKAHGFTPHITLAKVAPDAPSPVERIDPAPVAFTALHLVVEGAATAFPFDAAGYGGPWLAYRSAEPPVTRAAELPPVADVVAKAAAAAAEGEEPDEDDGPVRVHDFVKVNRPHRKDLVGRVKSLHRRGLVPDVDDDVMGTKAEPAARIQCYKAMGDGHVETEMHVGHACKDLEKIDALRPPSRRPAKAAAAPAPSPAAAVLPELPPLVAIPEADQVAAALSRLHTLLEPRAIGEIVGKELERRMGFV